MYGWTEKIISRGLWRRQYRDKRLEDRVSVTSSQNAEWSWDTAASRLAWELRREWAKGITQTASLTEPSNHRHCHLLGGLIRVCVWGEHGVSEWDATAVQSVSKTGLSFLLPRFWSALGAGDLLIYKSNCMLICETYLGEFQSFSIFQRSLDIEYLERSYTTLFQTWSFQ